MRVHSVHHVHCHSHDADNNDNEESDLVKLPNLPPSDNTATIDCTATEERQEMFEWLNFCHVVLPMIVPTQLSCCWYWIFAIGTITCNALVFGYFSTISFVGTLSDHHIIYTLLYCLASLFKLLARILVIYYYYVQFDYPWNRFTKHSIKHYKVLIHGANKRLLRWFILAWILFTAHIIHHTVQLINGQIAISHFLLFFIDLYFAEIPSMIAQFSCSILLLHAQLDLERMRDDIQIDAQRPRPMQKPIYWHDLKNAYKSHFSRFLYDYRIWFVIMLCKTASLLLWYWISFSRINQTTFQQMHVRITSVLWGLWNAVIVMEYVYSSDIVATAFHRLKAKLFAVDGVYQFMHSNDYCDYLYLVQYVTSYPLLVIYVNDTYVTIKTAAIYLSLFTFCMFATYQLF